MVPDTVALPPAELPDVFRRKSTEDLFFDQLARTFYLNPPPGHRARDAAFSRNLALVFHGLQLLWLGAVVFVLRRWRQTRLQAKLLLLAPLAFLLPFISFNLLAYYPRHIVAGHLVMAFSAIYAFSRRAERPSAEVAVRARGRNESVPHAAEA